MTDTLKKHVLYLFIPLLFYSLFFSYSIGLNLTQNIDKNNINRKNIKAADYDDIFGDIYIKRPSSSDIVKIGQNFTIEWNYKGSIETVCIALYRNYCFIDTISITTTNDGEYVWFVGNYTESNDYLIGIWDYNDFNNNDFSDLFIISSSSGYNAENYLLIIVIGILVAVVIFALSITLIKKKGIY